MKTRRPCHPRARCAIVFMLALAMISLIPQFLTAASNRFESTVIRGPLPRGPWVLEGPARPDHHVEALGEQAGVWGSLAEGFEGWVYPFKLFDGWSLSLSREGEVLMDLKSLATRQIATPHLAQLEYTGIGWHLTTTWFVPRSLPGALFLLDYQGASALELILRLRPSLAPMHLESGQPLTASWDEERRELVVREQSRHLELRVCCPWATGHRQVDNDGQHEIRFLLPPQVRRRGHVPIGISLGYSAQPEAQKVMHQLLTGTKDLLDNAIEHYAQRIARAPRIETPDPAANAALVWSVVSLHQLRIRHPDLGYGLVSGYSSSGRGTRPKYCWFFEEPTLTSCAYHWLGMSDQVREALRFLQRFQRDDGKTVHEIVQSLPYWKNYFQEFLYAYLHSDGPVYYLFAYGDYYRATGDLDFIRAEWPRIRRTLDWCFSAMDPADGLMRIEPRDWGSSESSRDVWKDTQLQGMWVRVLHDLERIARDMGELLVAERCQQRARQAEASIDSQLWDSEAGAYLWGLDRQGRPLNSLVPHHAVSFWLGSLPTPRIEPSLERMASADFRTDWGVRSLAWSDPKYDPQNYQAGSVWPVWNAGVIVSDYRHHRSAEAFRTWQAMVRARTLGGLGPMPEVLSGHRFERLTEGVPHQMFSELAVVNGFFDGLLGLRIDVPSRRIDLSPHLPPTWGTLRVDRIPCGPGSLSVRIERDRDNYKLAFDLNWPGGACVNLAPELPAGAQVRSVFLNGKIVACERDELPAATRLRLNIQECSGRHILRLRHADGVDWLPVDEPLVRAATSRNLRVVRARWEEPCWRFRLEGLPGRQYPIDFFTDRPVVASTTGELLEQRKGRSRLVFRAPPTGTTNAAGFVGWDAEIRFRPIP